MNWQNEIDNVANWMKQYCEQSGRKGYTVGLSGGIDSAIVCSLAVKAVGKENVFGVLLPCLSSQDSLEDAKKLTENLNIKYDIINLENSFFRLLDNIKYTMNNLTHGNIKARLRMTTIYAIAEIKQHLVAGTGNLSELMTGYATKYGDGGVDIEPIGNYYKTELYEMVKFLPEIPEHTIIKKPSADLWAGQSDEEELGMSYKELDKILCYIDNVNTLSLPEATWDFTKLDKVKNMIAKAKHKNNVPPRYVRTNN